MSFFVPTVQGLEICLEISVLSLLMGPYLINNSTVNMERFQKSRIKFPRLMTKIAEFYPARLSTGLFYTS